MKIVDLTQPLYDNMPVYPGDPEVKIKQVFKLKKDGWNMKTISLPSHVATHVNVPFHAIEEGKSLDDYTLDSFFCKSVVFTTLKDIQTETGLFFASASIEKKIIQEIIEIKPKFVGVQGYFETDNDLKTEKLFLKSGIISFEGLVNVEKLPRNKKFTFYGFPLKIKEGDGSPIRAVALFD